MGIAVSDSLAKPEATRPVGFMQSDSGGLEYHGRFFDLRAGAGTGWVSLRRDGSEFLRKEGAFVFFTPDGRTAWRFPDWTNMSHDESSGRMGSVSDGINLVKLTPHKTKPECELYIGANEPGAVTVAMFLAPDVQVEKSDDGALVLKAKSGKTLRLEALSSMKDAEGKPLPGPKLAVEERKHPDGSAGKALIIPIVGFTANAVKISYEAPEWTPPAAAKVRFDVINPDDPQPGDKKMLGPVNGVTNPIYRPDAAVDFGIVFDWNGPEPFKGVAEFEVINSLGGVDSYEKIPVGPVDPGTKGFRVAFHPKFPRAGVADAWGRLSDAAGNLLWVGRYRMAYDWPNYRPKIAVEPDFKAFWDETLAELRQIPLDPKIERVEEFADAPTFEIYRLSFNSWGNQRIHAMLFVPREGIRPLPAIVTAHPGTKGFGLNKGADGVYGSKLKHDPRFVTIVPLIRGHEPDADNIPFNHPWWGPLGDRDTYVARAWYCALVRSVDYLATRPDLVDMKRVVAKGGSQGGAFALVTAALDPRIAVCFADCPANCQPQEIMDNYPSFGPSIGQVPEGKTVADVQRALSYYNPVNFAPLIKCPTYVGSNIGDVTVHSLGPLAAYHNLTGLAPENKAFYPGFTHFHGSGPGLGVKAKEVLESLAGPLPPKEKPSE